MQQQLLLTAIAVLIGYSLSAPAGIGSIADDIAESISDVSTIQFYFFFDLVLQFVFLC